MYLYRVYLIYAADRKNPQIVTSGSVVAANDEQAKIRAGIFAKVDPAWDHDYVTIIAENVGEVKVKAKVQEVKQVTE
jgi:hypothetical protein